MSDSNSIQWLHTEKKNSQKFIYAEILIGKVKANIKFAIDSKTYVTFDKVLSKKPFKDEYGDDYSYWYAGYSADRTNETFMHYIEIRLGSMRHKAKAQCSEFFCRNLKWLASVKNVSELSELSENLTVTEQHNSPDSQGRAT